ncbi:Protein CBR-MUT-14 [Caenorhabditis briggsae]|uniref:ATP-dependent RNA helicase n=2 Tax=Caenorhabditis briggsae TaxID=6238 RepID=A0AAE9A9F0_CAEBR|nr:Protein CBR-MUT-14 [Caenorhabditis briggsae]ULT90156.1 hypothetical protein L3Y34_008494 [Caenorhabditis briggsae]UMM35957.1 hypothetical protein L5515_008338 [Caenorhabditis briggsae]CAP29300.1 Protein CBR-MUT-14 [Caenorhabditis briggsae]
MPTPWNKPESDEESPSAIAEPIYEGNVAPLQFDRILNFSEIDQKSYARNVRDRHRDRDVVASSKVDSTDIDVFCEENVNVYNHDTTDQPSDYDIEKELRKSLIDERLLNNLQKVKVERLNAVQRKSIRTVRDGVGLMVEAPTGIGKTYAFLIPAIERAMDERRKCKTVATKPSPFVLIMANTGTLVKQLFGRCELILGLKCMDGVNPIHDIKVDMLVAEHRFTADSCDIVFCTMGKLKATVESGDVLLDNLKMMILDEADKMIDTAAFGMDVEWILDQMKEEVVRELQSCFFSATFQRDRDAAITLTPLQMKMFGGKPWKLVHCPAMPGYITQHVIRLDRPGRDLTSHTWIKKMNIIRGLINEDLKTTDCKKEGPYKETIAIFCETIQRVAQVAMALRLLGYNFRPLCRTITKSQQEVTINDLEFKRIHGIVCTNIMSRGIDVSSIKHTIIMEMSSDFDTYKHRIGRVGRDGFGGKATVLIDHDTLMNPRSAQIVDALYVFMDQCQQPAPQWLKEWFERRHADEQYY